MHDVLCTKQTNSRRESSETIGPGQIRQLPRGVERPRMPARWAATRLPCAARLPETMLAASLQLGASPLATSRPARVHVIATTHARS